MDKTLKNGIDREWIKACYGHIHCAPVIHDEDIGAAILTF